MNFNNTSYPPIPCGAAKVAMKTKFPSSGVNLLKVLDKTFSKIEILAQFLPIII